MFSLGAKSCFAPVAKTCFAMLQKPVLHRDALIIAPLCACWVMHHSVPVVLLLGTTNRVTMDCIPCMLACRRLHTRGLSRGVWYQGRPPRWCLVCGASAGKEMRAVTERGVVGNRGGHYHYLKSTYLYVRTKCYSALQSAHQRHCGRREL